MACRRLDHLDLRVRDLGAAEAFYAHFLPEVGFPIRRDEPGHALQFEARSGHPPPEFVALIEDPAHRPNASRIAFWAESRAEVDRLGSILEHAGAKNLEGPMACPEYSPEYYAVFFEDPSGNRLEVCCRVADK
jgi:catechol 2,3-dioxygenase-like lactoylglutathione lyase family enzyme